MHSLPEHCSAHSEFHQASSLLKEEITAAHEYFSQKYPHFPILHTTQDDEIFLVGLESDMCATLRSQEKVHHWNNEDIQSIVEYICLFIRGMYFLEASHALNKIGNMVMEVETIISNDHSNLTII